MDLFGQHVSWHVMDVIISLWFYVVCYSLLHMACFWSPWMCVCVSVSLIGGWRIGWMEVVYAYVYLLMYLSHMHLWW